MPSILFSRFSEVDDFSTPAQIILYNTCAFLGLFLNVAALVPALFSSSVRRSRIWINLMISFIVLSSSYLLLVGRQTGPEPPFGLCAFQATLRYACPALCGAGAVCFAIDYYLRLSTMLFYGKELSQRKITVLLTFPWVIFVAIFIEASLSVQTHESIERDTTHLYCHITNPIPSLTVGILIILAGLVIFPLQFYTTIILYRNWKAFRHLSQSCDSLSLSMFIRLALFAIGMAMATALSTFIVPRINQSVPKATWSVVLALVPVITALAFGTQQDILRALLFWRNYAPNSSDTLATQRLSQRPSQPLHNFSFYIKKSSP